MKLNSVLLMFCLMFATACATYRTDTSITFDSLKVPEYETNVKIGTNDFSEQKHEKIGPVYVEVKKLTIFNADPTKEQANYVLIKKAEALGADAVVDVDYDSGWGMFTWGYVSAKGIAVRNKAVAVTPVPKKMKSKSKK